MGTRAGFGEGNMRAVVIVSGLLTCLLTTGVVSSMGQIFHRAA